MCDIHDFKKIRTHKPAFIINNEDEKTKFIALWHLYNELKNNHLFHHESELRSADGQHIDAEILTLLVEHLNPDVEADDSAAAEEEEQGKEEQGSGRAPGALYVLRLHY